MVDGLVPHAFTRPRGTVDVRNRAIVHSAHLLRGRRGARAVAMAALPTHLAGAVTFDSLVDAEPGDEHDAAQVEVRQALGRPHAPQLEILVGDFP